MEQEKSVSSLIFNQSNINNDQQQSSDEDSHQNSNNIKQDGQIVIKRKKRSKVWAYFKLSEDQKDVLCCLCSWNKIYNNSTTKLKSHLKKCHQNQFDEMEGINPSQNKKTNEINDTFSKEKFQPLSMISSQPFKQLFGDSKSTLHFPSEPTIKKYIQNLAYILRQNMKQKFKKSFDEFKSFSLNFDHWKSNSNKKFITLNIRFIDDQYRLRNTNLSTFQCEDENSNAIVDDITRTLKNFDLYYEKEAKEESQNISRSDNKKEQFDLQDIFCICDGASTNKSAYTKLKFISYQLICMCHIIHNSILAAINSCEEVKSVVQKVSDLASSIRKSSKKTSLLEKELEKLGIDIIKIKISSKTRWNSTLAMMISIQHCMKGIQNLQQFYKILNSFILSDQDQQILKQLIEVLKGLEQISLVFQSNQIPSASYILPYIQQIREEFTIENQQWFLIKNFNSILLKQFNNRIQTHIEKDSIQLFISSYLNPFFKEDMKENNTIQYMKMIELFHQCLEIPRIQGHMNLRITQIKKPKRLSNVFRKSEGILDNLNIDLKQIINSEIEYYNQITYEENNFVDSELHPSLNFWKIHQSKLPFLNILAKKYLSIPASSAESERVFSAMGNLITKLRNKLNSETASEIIYIHLNLKNEFISFNELQNIFVQQIYNQQN